MSSVASEARRPRYCKSPQNSLLEELVIGLVTSASLVDNYVLFIHYRLDKNKVTIFETFSFKIFLHHTPVNPKFLDQNMGLNRSLYEDTILLTLAKIYADF